MRLIIVKVAISVFLLVAIAFLVRTGLTLAANSPELGVLMVQPDTSIRRFKEIGHACQGGNGVWVTGYKTYSGRSLSLEGSTHDSVFEARQKLQDHLQRATRIEERGNKYDQQGQIIGERVIAFFEVEEKEWVSILWLERESTFVITAASLAEALEFEHLKYP